MDEMRVELLCFHLKNSQSDRQDYLEILDKFHCNQENFNKGEEKIVERRERIQQKKFTSRTKLCCFRVNVRWFMFSIGVTIAS